MWKVPKKNISSKLADIVRPGDARRRSKETPQLKPDLASQFAPEKTSPSSAYSAASSAPHRRFSIVRFALVFLAVVILIGGAFGYYAYRAEHITLAAVGSQLERFYSLLGHGGEAAVLPGAPAAVPEDNKFSLDKLGDIFSFFKNIGKNYKSFQALSSNGLEILSELKTLERTAVADAFNGRGEAIITRLERLHELVGSVAAVTNDLQSGTSLAASILPIGEGAYFDAHVDIERVNNFLGSLIDWLKEDRDHHIAVFLENPSEIRPGGGFLGSYLELTIHKGNVVKSEVHAINDADKVLERKIVPPEPLQLIVRRFRAADANWFFDFPESASTTLGLLESSDLYRTQNITFDMAIGVSGQAVEELLALTGPVKLAGGTTIDAKNFLNVLQESVQNGQEQGVDDPKGLLRAFAPELIKKLSALPTDKQDSFVTQLQSWFEKRDLRIYAKDPAFQTFFEAYGATGKTYQLPEKFNGDYLAVVDANIGGGKSDLFIEQTIKLESQLSEDGTIANHLTVSRKHTASTDEPWWYTATNQSYLQVFTLPSAALDYSEGGLVKTIVPRPEYIKEKYEINPHVAVVEATKKTQLANSTIATFKDGGKNVFATWLRTERGETTDLSLSYASRLPNNLINGSVYQFVFEKQSGVTGMYQFQINAPVGFVFEENNLPVYEFKSNDPPGRLVVTLTLRAITAADL